MDNNRTFWTKYDQSSLTKKIGSIPSKALYLVHTPGDLIHLDQSLILSRALVDKGILFKQQVSYLVQSVRKFELPRHLRSTWRGTKIRRPSSTCTSPWRAT